MLPPHVKLEAGTMIMSTVRLVRPLAVGGMGTVWVADHTTLETQVAVKIMTAELTRNPEVSQRFSREAAASARVKSPHVVQVFDHGTTADGLPFIVMELLDGRDLAHLLQGVPLELSVVTEIVSQTCKALSRAHAAGVVHRDIKPDNIFVCDTDGGEPFVKLLDFGIAKSEAGPVSMNVTVPGSVFGTPLYMSPEQLVGSPTDFRTDLWSLGVVAFEALTGRTPYEGDALGAVALAAHAPLPAPSSLRAGLPPWVDAWFQKACAIAPADRFASAAEMAKAMRDPVGAPAVSHLLPAVPASKAEASQMSTTMVPSSRSAALPTSRPGAKIGFALAALAVIAAVGFVFGRGNPPEMAAAPLKSKIAVVPSAPEPLDAAFAPWLVASAMPTASSSAPKQLPSGHKAAPPRPREPKKPAEYNDIK